jgi:tetratricopeptide (TPR) repeat protein
MNDESKITMSLEYIGNVYFMLKVFDSAIYFTKMAYAKSTLVNDKIAMADELNNLGDTYARLKKNDLAAEYYRLAINLEITTKDMTNFQQSNLGIAYIFQRLNENDSALKYANQAMSASISSHFFAGQLASSNLIVTVYESEKKTDSAFKYLKLNMIAKDSLFNQERSKIVGNLTFQENRRQLEISEQKEKSEDDHIRNLQLLAIGVFIPFFFLVVLFLSRTKVNARVVEFLGIVGLLLLFEFITDLIYPYISIWTNENPVWEMLILVILAALLEPFNNRLEHWVKSRLVRKSITEPTPMLVEGITFDDVN